MTEPSDSTELWEVAVPIIDAVVLEASDNELFFTLIPEPPMTEPQSKTTEAVQSLCDFLNDRRPTPVQGFDVGPTKEFTLSNSQMRAIAEKYLKMEEAIRFACDDCSCDNCEWMFEEAVLKGEQAKPCGMHDRLMKARDFDPLTP